MSAEVAEDTKNPCPICAGDLSLGSYTSLCNHTFCMECIMIWSNHLNKQSSPTTCPVCRATISRNHIFTRNYSFFFTLPGVKNYQTLVLLRMMQAGWMAHLTPFITLQSEQYACSHFSRLKICDKATYFLTPDLCCEYAKLHNKRLSFVAYENKGQFGNDLSLFKTLDGIFRDKIMNDSNDSVNSVSSTSYTSFIERPNDINPYFLPYVLFQLPLKHQERLYVYDWSDSISPNPDDALTHHVLDTNQKYKCRFIISITFNKTKTSENSFNITPCMKAKHVMLEKLATAAVDQ